MKLEYFILGLLILRPSTGYEIKKNLDSDWRFARKRAPLSQIYNTFRITSYNVCYTKLLRSVSVTIQPSLYDFTITDIQTAQPLEYCLSTIKNKLKSQLEHLGLEQYKCILGGSNNFRLQLPSPEQYKSNRDRNNFV